MNAISGIKGMGCLAGLSWVYSVQTACTLTTCRVPCSQQTVLQAPPDQVAATGITHKFLMDKEKATVVLWIAECNKLSFKVHQG